MILITGATGNTGSRVARRLAERAGPDTMLALVRPESDISELTESGILSHRCDFDVPSSYVPVVHAGDTFVGISNLRHCDAMLPYLVEAGVARAHCVTTTAVFSSFHSYGAHYREIEERLRALPIPVSLLRPSMIYGNRHDHNMKRLIRMLVRTPVFPVFGDGDALMQPVHVDDLAGGIATAIERDAVGAYNLAGPAAITYNEILSEIAGALGRDVRLVHLNHRAVARLVKVLQYLPGFPVRQVQVMRLTEDKAFDISDAVRDLEFRPRSFATGIREEIADVLGASVLKARAA
jgi:nucleoside-diphosphate-sugar epimerase